MVFIFMFHLSFHYLQKCLNFFLFFFFFEGTFSELLVSTFQTRLFSFLFALFCRRLGKNKIIIFHFHPDALQIFLKTGERASRMRRTANEVFQAFYNFLPHFPITLDLFIHFFFFSLTYKGYRKVWEKNYFQILSTRKKTDKILWLCFVYVWHELYNWYLLVYIQKREIFKLKYWD